MSAREAATRLAHEGPNDLPTARRRSLLALALGVAREPMFLLLLAAGTLYLVLGDVRESLSLSLILAVPGVRDLFGFAVLHPPDVALCLAAGIVSILWFEALKVVRLSHGPHARSVS